MIGSGGHTAEMIKLITKLSTNVYAPRHYVLADSDFHSESRVRKELMRGDDNHRSTRFWTIPRSREVGQSWISTPWTSAWAFFACLKLIGQIQPDVVLCNGPGTCVPLALAVKLRQFLGHSARTKIIFCESLARVRGLSLTGKLAYYGFADRVVVHWPALQQRYVCVSLDERRCLSRGVAHHESCLVRYPSSEYLGVIC